MEYAEKELLKQKIKFKYFYFTDTVIDNLEKNDEDFNGEDCRKILMEFQSAIEDILNETYEDLKKHGQ